MSSTGEIIGGLIIPVVAGILNGSWNAAFSPAANLAVSPDPNSSNTDNKQKSYDLGHHHAWALFQFYAAIANVILCLFWAGGPSRVSYIVSEASSLSVFLVSLFGVLMGVGIVLFGEACRIAGVGMGTNLNIGIIMILGTLLPLALNNQVSTPSGGMIFAGLFVSSLGLFFSMKSLQARTRDEIQQAFDDDKTPKSLNVSTNHTQESSSSDAADEELGKESTPTACSDKPRETEEENFPPVVTHSTFTKIAICVLAAVFSSTLQFAFVFGDDLIDIAESPGGPGSTPKSGSAAIIWLFVIPLSTIPNIAYALYESRSIPLAHLWRCPASRHVKIFICACLPWIGHIHLYGIAANQLLPADVAAAVAWPILMMTTVAWGMILSIYLGEWKGASADAQKKQKMGLGFMTFGVAIVMVSVAL